VGHGVKEVRVPCGHFHVENGKILAPAPDFSGVEGGRGLGRGVAGGDYQEDRPRDGRGRRESEEAQGIPPGGMRAARYL